MTTDPSAASSARRDALALTGEARGWRLIPITTLRELRPALDYLAPYSKDIASFFAGTGQAVTARDATGHLARIQPILNHSALTLLGATERQAMERLLGMGLARLVTLRGTNAYPKPGTLATPGPYTGRYHGVARDDNHR